MPSKEGERNACEWERRELGIRNTGTQEHGAVVVGNDARYWILGSTVVVETAVVNCE
jgi:hypothetical protein